MNLKLTIGLLLGLWLWACSTSPSGPVMDQVSGKDDVDSPRTDATTRSADAVTELGTVDVRKPNEDLVTDGREDPEDGAFADESGQSDAPAPVDGTTDGDEPGADLPPDLSMDTPGEPEVSVSTYAEASTVPAGFPLQFSCKVYGLPEGTYVTYLQIAGPADIDVDELAVVFYQAGKYSVACRAKWNDGEVVDETPLKIDVQPGEAAFVETALSKNAVKAGETVMVTCTVKDAFGNFVETPTKIAVNPQVGLDVYGVKILAIKAGTYDVACVEPLSATADPTPEKLTVSPGIPKKIETTLEKDTIVAGESTQVTCQAVDAFGNEVAGFPVAVFLSPGLTIEVFSVSGQKAGTFQVICVPQNESWDFFSLTPRLLTVIPGAASGVSLEAVPAKPVYKMFETIQFVATAVDDYGNLVDGVELAPMTYEPETEGIIQKDTMKYKFEAEGVFVFSACLAEDLNVCGEREVVVDGYGPVITIKYPGRGATLMGKPAVNVSGNVVDPVSGVTEFSINGNKVPLDENGDFVYPITAKQGMNMLVAVAEDPNGFKTLLVQAFYYSPVWHKVDINDPDGSMITDSLQFWLNDDFFDKVPHNYSKPDNLSTIVEMALKDLDIGSFIPNPVASAGPYKVYVGPFSYSPPVVHIKPFESGLLAEAHIYNIEVKVEAKGKCKVLFIDLCPDVSGKVKIDEIQLWEGLYIWAEDGKIKMSQYENHIGIYNVQVDIDGLLGFLFNWLINYFVGQYVGELEQTAMEMVDEQVQDILGGILDTLALNQQLEIPNPLNPDAPPIELSLVSSFRELKFMDQGLEVRLDAAILAPKNINKNPLGSIGRASCLNWSPEKFVLDIQEFIIMAIHDDLVNEILFSAWWAGLLDMQLPMDSLLDETSLEDLGLGTLEDLGIKDIVASTEFFLPPIVTSCTDDDELELQVGDIYVELNMKMLNEPVTIGMFASLAAEAAIDVISIPGGQEVSLGIGEIDPIVAQITYISDNLKGAEGFLTMIVQGILLPVLLESLAEGSLASFPLPEFNLSEMAPGYLPANLVWKFVIDSFYRDKGFTVLVAHVEAQ